MTVNELPYALPWMNLIISVIAFMAITWILVRRSQGVRRLFINMTGWTAIAVLVAGAAFQANIIFLDLWVLIGTGGRLAVLVLILLFLFTPEAQDTDG